MELEHHHDWLVGASGMVMILIGLLAWMLRSEQQSTIGFIFAMTGLVITVISLNQIENDIKMRKIRMCKE
jgi:hypothetical protein